MRVKSIGTSIVTRKYFRAGDRQKTPIVEVEIGKPEPSPFAAGEFICAFRISEGGNTKLESTFGIDEMQALLLALSAVKSQLSLLNQNLNGSLRWLGDENGDLGFSLRDYSSE
jgi:hypothetical protein